MNTHTEPMSGQCLCGAVRFHAMPKSLEMGACHCAMCRRWSGGVFMAVDCSGALKIEDQSALGVYKSSQWGERCFCKTCGSTLFWRTQDGSHISVAAQAFDDVARFAFTSEIFIEEKPASYTFANPTTKLTGAEVFAAFAPAS